MDRELTKIEQRNQLGPHLKWILIISVLLISGIFTIRHFVRPSIKANEVVIAEVERGPIENTLAASGHLEPAFETVINASIASEISEVHIRPGDEVKAGDRILTLNQEFIKLQVEALQDELSLKQNNVKKSAIEHKQMVEELEYENEILGLNIKAMRAALNDLKQLKEVGGATVGEVETATLNFEVRELEKKKLESELLYRAAIFEREQENLELEVSIKQKDLVKLKRKLEQAEVQSQVTGIVTWINANIGQQVSEGSALVRIADLSHFQIKGSISDRYSSEIRVGQPVQIRIGNSRYTGYVASILPEVLNNTFEFIVAFAQTPDQSMKPNMSAEIFLVTASKPEALLLKNGPGYNGSKETDFFIVRGDYAYRSRLKVGLVNADFIELLDNEVYEKDKIIISDMKRFDRADRVKIEK